MNWLRSLWSSTYAATGVLLWIVGVILAFLIFGKIAEMIWPITTAIFFLLGTGFAFSKSTPRGIVTVAAICLYISSWLLLGISEPWISRLCWSVSVLLWFGTVFKDLIWDLPRTSS